MKRILAILFCFVYLASSAGVNFNLHYCGGKIKSVSLFHSDEKDCCGNKMKKKDCCKERSFTYKVKDNQNASSKIASFKIVKTDEAVTPALSNNFFKSTFATGSMFLLDDPPDIETNSLFVLYRTFRI